MTDRALLSVNDLARVLGISRRSVFALLAAGIAPKSLLVGGMRRFRPEAVDRWLAEKEAHADAVQRAARAD
ncbi:MAG: helix-turn-helix domain-containing protein [Bauldia sp.]|nr:helix-turn-helix domain-containing protein [Bauldia sp.]